MFVTGLTIFFYSRTPSFLSLHLPLHTPCVYFHPVTNSYRPQG